ncbi:MAG: hypothetical protein FWE68_06505 [Defluviitaleaceae bacterium]|nr:hypothetical protein [Defluviitaleaceae bacterium]
MDMDLDTLIQLMEMMNPGDSGVNPAEARNRQIMFTMLKLMETKRMMETYGAPYAQGGREDWSLSMLSSLRPHMTNERRHMTDILIKFFEIRQLLNHMHTGANADGF